MEQIIANGLSSIRVGLEDYEIASSHPDGGRLTSAVRNVFAGIVILAKAKLYELSPPETPGILIREMRPQLVKQRLELLPVGRKTIGYGEIKSRFMHFGLKLDWARIDRIHEIRNDLEHFYHDGSISNVQEALADAAIVIRSLLNILSLDPIRDLGEKWWEVLLKNGQLHAAESKECLSTFSSVKWVNSAASGCLAFFTCEKCGSNLIRQADSENTEQPEIIPVCGACGTTNDFGALMERAVKNGYYGELYETQTQGGEPPVVYCPTCHRFTLILEAGHCAACNASLGPSTRWCDNCRMPWSDQDVASDTHECLPWFQ